MGRFFKSLLLGDELRHLVHLLSKMHANNVCRYLERLTLVGTFARLRVGEKCYLHIITRHLEPLRQVKQISLHFQNR